MRLIELLTIGGALSSAIRGGNRSGGNEERDSKGNGKSKIGGLYLRQFVTRRTRRVEMRDAARLRIGVDDSNRPVGEVCRRLLRSVLKGSRCHCGYCSTIGK